MWWSDCDHIILGASLSKGRAVHLFSLSGKLVGYTYLSIFSKYSSACCKNLEGFGAKSKSQSLRH